MIGILLLAIGIISYILRFKKLSLFIFFTFMLKGWVVLTDDVIGQKNYDLAFVYTFVILIYSCMFERASTPIYDKRIHKWLYIFLVFLVLSIMFSYNHYGFTPYQILQGSRASFLFLSFFFLRKTRAKDLWWLNETFFYITLITSVLYILEVFFDLHLLPYDISKLKVDDYTGINRYYNSPPLLYWYIFATILTPHLIKSRLTFISIFIFGLALIATLGRTQIAMTTGVVLLGLVWQGKARSIFSALAVALLLVAPFADTISARFTGQFENSTESDVKSIFNGGIEQTVRAGNTYNVGNLTYRLAWVYERAQYLQDRPISENIYGLGLISDSQVLTVQKHYSFMIGLLDDDNNIWQLGTPDISYGNILTKYGYVGGILFLMIWIVLLSTFFKYRNQDDLAFVGFLLLVNYFLLGFSGTIISDQGNMAFPFALFILIAQKVATHSLTKEPNETQDEN